MKKTILIIGTADTKSDELQYMKSCMERIGGCACVMDVGVLGEPKFPVEYTKHDVAAAAQTANADIIALGDENAAMTKTSEGACALTRKLASEGKIQGVLMLGGTMGTDLALDVADALPFGFPKFIISTVSFSHLIPPDRLSPDLMMILWSGGLYGLNSICKAALSQACGAVLGAAQAVEIPTFERPVVGMTSLGSSALTYMKILKPELEKRGFEVAVFHTTGLGGRALENLANKKRFVAVLDLGLAEIANESVDSVVTSGKNRLENAGLAGIPQIVAGGGLGLIDLPTWSKMPKKYAHRAYHAHNRLIASVLMDAKEMKKLARIIAQKLRKATAPTVYISTLKGWIEWDRVGEPLYQPENLQAFSSELKKAIQYPVQLIELDAHINDKIFADKVLEIFDNWVEQGIIQKSAN
ncbi:MAG: hypothetical protein RLZZ628_295 [Bacteroidota bacterium]|jgi:uncharacterized protein (UPF0261 family)